jgi:hypothetical protein
VNALEERLDDGKQYRKALVVAALTGAYDRLYLLGIQNWRIASTTTGISRHGSWAKDGVPGPRRAGARTGRPVGSTQWNRIAQQQRVFDDVRVHQSGPREQPELHNGIKPHAPGLRADSDEVARLFRSYLAWHSGLISPIVPISNRPGPSTSSGQFRAP